MSVRIGQGFDVHRFATGRPLWLGGVEIPHHQGLEGHSDADVLLHAVMDALLGAAGLPDIGHFFPNTDEAYRNIPSVELLRQVATEIRAHGFELGNIDATVLAEAPKIAPFIGEMKQVIGGVLGISGGQIAIKATTMEQLGFVGRKEGIAALAVALLVVGSGTAEERAIARS